MSNNMSSCCGGKSSMKARNRQIPFSQVSRPMASLAPKQGLTLLTFIGKGHTTRSYYGIQGRRYLFGGNAHQTGYVENSDVDFMLAMRENGNPILVRTPITRPVVQVVPVVEVKVMEDTIPEPEPIPTPIPARKTRTKKAQ